MKISNYLSRIKQSRLAIALFSSLYFASPVSAQNEIEEILVRSELRPSAVQETANSISVIAADAIADRQAGFLTDVLGAAPNLNYSSGASRGRFFQIRGIGERSQFIDPLNPGVGLLIDGIDFSTLGAAATLLDIDQIEVLRGPQGTIFGANALAGLINMQSASPTNDTELLVGVGAGDISDNAGALDLWSAKLIANQPINDDIAARFAIAQNSSDGNVSNTYLNRDDTQKIDETTARFKLSWQTPGSHSQLTVLKLDVNNGYDAFTLDNSRQSLADQPGSDKLDATALALDSRFDLSSSLQANALLSVSQADSEYSYDEDWTNPTICVGVPCPGFEYMSFDQYLRNTNTQSADGRLLKESPVGDWVFGIYLKNTQADLDRNYTYAAPFNSDYSQQNSALYGQWQQSLTQNWSLTLGARFEHIESDYRDSLAQTTDTGEDLAGGHLTLSFQSSDDSFSYLRIASGYKSGGINVAQGSAIPLRYATETLINFELGHNSQWSDRFSSRTALFYQDRSNAQVKQSLVTCSPACTFDDFTDNAAQAHSIGLEAELAYQASRQLDLTASIGLLQSEFDEYQSFSHVKAVDTGSGVIPYDMSGEETAQSPAYQLTLEARWAISSRSSLWIALESKDKFRFSNRHLAESEAYRLLNARWNWQAEHIGFSLWGRNLTNETYATRGFGSFNNDPREINLGPYVQLGEPRQIGVSVEYQF